MKWNFGCIDVQLYMTYLKMYRIIQCERSVKSKIDTGVQAN